MKPQHAVIGTAMRRQALAWLEYREHRGFETGDLPYNSPCLGTERNIGCGPDPVGDQHEYLPASVSGDCGGVDGEILDLGELVLTKEHAIEFFSDGPPLAFHLRRPRKRGIVVNAGVPELGIFQVPSLGKGNDPHEQACASTRSCHRHDTVSRPALLN